MRLLILGDRNIYSNFVLELVFMFCMSASYGGLFNGLSPFISLYLWCSVCGSSIFHAPGVRQYIIR